jgi:hypothetical protein
MTSVSDAPKTIMPGFVQTHGEEGVGVGVCSDKMWLVNFLLPVFSAFYLPLYAYQLSVTIRNTITASAHRPFQSDR